MPRVTLYYGNLASHSKSQVGPLRAITGLIQDMAIAHDALGSRRLDSWKEIANFLGRGQRTVKRWEAERGMPVHRVPGGGVVFAYSEELSRWLKGTGPESEVSGKENELRNRTDVATPSDPASTMHPFNGDLLSVSGGNSTKSSAAIAFPDENRRPVGAAPSAAVWVAPLLLFGVLSLLFYSSHKELHFRAQASPHVTNPEAQDLYLKGRYYWNRRTPEDLDNAVGYFTQAIVVDPRDAAAYVGLADCYNLLREFGAMPASDAYPRALAAAQRAVELDDRSAEAHNSLAFVTFWWSWQAASAEREFKRALGLDPNFARGHHWYATSLMAVGRFPEALDQLEQARKLEPSSTAILADKGYALWFAGEHAEGLSLLQQLESTEPTLSSTHDYLARIDWERKDYRNAIREWKLSAELRKDKVSLEMANARAEGFEAGGLTGMWGNLLPVQEKYFARGLGSAHALAETCAALGKKQEAIAYLQTAFERREAGMLRLKLDESLRSLRDDPAFQELATRVSERLAQ